MTGVGDIGTILSIADIATRVCLRLARFIDESKEAGATRDNLSRRLLTMNTLLETVKSATAERKDKVRLIPISVDEGRILSTMKTTVDHCESTIQRLEEKVKSLKQNQRDPNWRQRIMLQLRLDVSGSSIERIERDIEADTEALQLLFICLTP